MNPRIIIYTGLILEGAACTIDGRDTQMHLAPENGRLVQEQYSSGVQWGLSESRCFTGDWQDRGRENEGEETKGGVMKRFPVLRFFGAIVQFGFASLSDLSLCRR